MIVVDTSVWISVLRSVGSPEAPALSALMDHDEVALPVPVRVELLGGARRADGARLRRALSGLPLLYPTDETWSLLDQWALRAAKAGERFGVGDLLIAALAQDIGGLVWSLDADFARMARLGFVQLYA